MNEWALCSWRSHGTKSAMLESKLSTGTSRTKRLHQDKFAFSLFWTSQCVACSPAWWILYHVSASCKGPIRLLTANSSPVVSHKRGGRERDPSRSLRARTHASRVPSPHLIETTGDKSVLTASFNNTRTMKFKIQSTVSLFTAVNHCSGPLRNHPQPPPKKVLLIEVKRSFLAL